LTPPADRGTRAGWCQLAAREARDSTLRANGIALAEVLARRNLMNASRFYLAPVLVSLLAAPIGCADIDDDQPIEPIAALDLATGNRLEFYEPSPGLLMVSELGTAGGSPTERAGRTPVELYRELASDRAVPPALVAAQRRAEERQVDAAPGRQPALQIEQSVSGSNIAPPGELSFIDNQSCDDQWFSNKFCGGSPDWQMCLLNHWNGAWAQLSSVDHVDHAVCADIGAITLKVQMGDGTGGIWDVPEGHWRSFSWQDGCLFGCNTSTRGDVLNASNNRFHYAVNAWF